MTFLVWSQRFCNRPVFRRGGNSSLVLVFGLAWGVSRSLSQEGDASNDDGSSSGGDSDDPFGLTRAAAEDDHAQPVAPTVARFVHFKLLSAHGQCSASVGWSRDVFPPVAIHCCALLRDGPTRCPVHPLRGG